MLHLFNAVEIVKAVGLLGIIFIIFAESGLLIGFFLPGDSLLFTAGILASQGYINIFALSIASFIAAVAGDNVGYAFGERVGPRLFSRKDSFFFHKDHLERAKLFFGQHGKKSLILARFVPVVRTFVPILAGVGAMNYRTFFNYNMLGALIWAVGVSLLGYFLGNVVPDIDRYILVIALVIIVISVIPGLIGVIRHRRSKQ
ncbi:VTT domain-containing protein [Candidatus Parcubacteria bacterium]|nr:VTT domain-containing protein [Candidatus Parcubacteria bacterium]